MRIVKREDALLGTALLFITASAAEPVEMARVKWGIDAQALLHASEC